MKVAKIYPTNEQGHVIEIGRATWDDDETSVRNRYPTSNGGFSPRSSSELPVRDLDTLLGAVAAEDLIKPEALAGMISALSASLHRQLIPKDLPA